MPSGREVKWPFLLDEWGIGRAFRCARPIAQRDRSLFVRQGRFGIAPPGSPTMTIFDRVSDLELFSECIRALTDGRLVSSAA